MYNFFKNIAKKDSCSSVGACSIHPSVSALHQIILNEIREISFYIVKLKEFKIKDEKAEKLAIDGLSIFLINTSYNEQNYLNFVLELYTTKTRIKNTYIKYCVDNGFPFETINKDFKIDKNTTITYLINYAQNSLPNIQKNLDKRKQRLFELITIFSRLFAIEITKIKNLDHNFCDFDFELLRFFALTNSYSIRNEKIIRRIYEFSDFSLKIIKKLSQLQKEKYGIKENAKTNISLNNGHCILISGDDLNELEQLLKTIEESDLKEEINVYTHGPLFLAHFYPYFKNNKFLKGHFGTGDAAYDFSIFSGAILLTQNFIQKIDNLYRGEIFSNKLISFSKVFNIKNNNYMPVINSSLELENCKQEKNKNVEIEYNSSKISKILDEENFEEIVILSSSIEDKEKIYNYKNKKIIEINCPLENDILLNDIKILKEKNIKITLFLTDCNLTNLKLLLSLLNQNINLHIANCPHALISPHVIESLENDFNVNII